MKIRKHPYIGKPKHQFWKNISPKGDSIQINLDHIVKSSFKIEKEEKVVTAGSCFAQHVARYLSNSGMNHYISEPGHPIIPKKIRDNFNYGLFSARYGNIYTPAQLLQLLKRAYGTFKPVEDFWEIPNGNFIDPFRPNIHPGGFMSLNEATIDLEQHYGCIRESIENMDVFVFTLGLTEAWVDKRDGAVFPISPGIVGGYFDEDKYKFHNYTVQETVKNMNESIQFIRSKNPNVKIIITVSPVPLNATAIDQHVLVSTTYSKAVLRVAAEEVCNSHRNVEYFPSYEIITSPNSNYYSSDYRSVLEEGVNTVMNAFFKAYTDIELQEATCPQEEIDTHTKDMEKIIQVLCDEESIKDE